MQSLPHELQNYIMVYTGQLKLRGGKWCTQINNELLNKITILLKHKFDTYECIKSHGISGSFAFCIDQKINHWITFPSLNGFL